MHSEDVKTAITITIENPDQPDILHLLEEGEAYGADLYPPESNHYLSVASLQAPEVRFHVARDETGRAVGTGALVLHGDWAEIKRMWVVPSGRRRGLGRALLSALEAAARAEGIRVLRLETGIHNDEALVLYERMGYVTRGPFADYAPDPLSVFMEKELG